MIITRQPRYVDFDPIAARPLPRVQDSGGADNRSECNEEQDQRSFTVSSSVHTAPPHPAKKHRMGHRSIVIDVHEEDNVDLNSITDISISWSASFLLSFFSITIERFFSTSEDHYDEINRHEKTEDFLKRFNAYSCHWFAESLAQESWTVTKMSKGGRSLNLEKLNAILVGAFELSRRRWWRSQLYRL